MSLPRAKPSKLGWIVDPEILAEVCKEVNAAGWESCMEAVEVAMLVAERMIQDEGG